jgi:hypothetical protein
LQKKINNYYVVCAVCFMYTKMRSYPVLQLFVFIFLSLVKRRLLTKYSAEIVNCLVYH